MEKWRHPYGYVKYMIIDRSMLVLDAVGFPRFTVHASLITLHRKKRTGEKCSGVFVGATCQRARHCVAAFASLESREVDLLFEMG